jgi:hypothetical protein
VNFIHKQYGGLAELFALGGALNYLLNVGDAAGDGRNFFKCKVAARGDNPGQRCLAGGRAKI